MSLIKCPECGREISDQAKKCIHCGKELFHCPECGKTTVRHGNTCPQCGYELINEENNLKSEPVDEIKNGPIEPRYNNLPMRPFASLEKKEQNALYDEFDKRYPQYPRKSVENKTIIYTLITFVFLIPILMIVIGFVVRYEKREHFFDDRPWDYAGLEGFTDDE